jgi:superfamily II DNA or RNA helicase
MFLEFAEKTTVIAAQLPEMLIDGVLKTIVPRPEQLAVMYLLLTSNHQRTLIQLVTGFGKSLMFGLLA